MAQTPPPPSVSVAKPIVREVTDADEFIGRFQAAEEVSVRSRVGGYLDSIAFKDGSLVKQGDLLFQIDQRPYVTARDSAQASLAVANSSLTYAKAQFDRVNALVTSGSQTVATLDDRRRELQSAEANLQGAKASLERANLDLTYSRITAPLTGRIDRHLISVGNLVQADITPLTTIVSLDPIDFYFDVDERRLLSYAEAARAKGSVLQEGGGGLEVTVKLGDRDQTMFKGKLDFSENRVDAESGTMRVRASFPNPNFVLQPGLFGRLELKGSNSYTAVLVPDEAISADQNERIVYVLNPDNTVVTKPVRTGPKILGYRAIRGGLKGDETIVIRGVVKVRPGIKVAPVQVVLPPQSDDAPASSQEAAVVETTK
ncbi:MULTISPECIES: efflux RND transporter periplasmic adaptor subunit [unclassified Rhizobium]|nr:MULTISPECIES: efflux RND transporter periplasmic adaptor subunit [unclassified Rhizobium]